MRKNMKKLISALLAASMLLASFGTAAFADADTDAKTSDPAVTTAEPTASPDASAQPEASTEPSASPEASTAPSASPEATETPAPTAAPSSDNYYNEAIGLLSALGIFEGYEDGSFQPDSTITRAEMSAVILRTLHTTASTKYTGIFTDVTDSHWAADTVQAAYNAGIINGIGDGTFNPDGNVTYDQAVKMIVCALNYGQYAQAQGGYPTGYMLVASMKDVEVTKNAKGEVGQAATRGTVAKMIYNALNADYPTVTGMEGGMPKYTTQDGKTLASEMHKVYWTEGVLTATPLKTIDASVTPTSEQIVIDGDVYTNKLKANAEDLVAKYVKVYYYDEDNNGSDMEAIYAYPVASKNKTVTVEAKDVNELRNLQSNVRGEIEYEDEKGSTKTYKTVASPILVLNGQLFNEANEDMTIYDEDGNDTNQDYTVEEYLKPEVGTITLSDFDADGYYDVVMVEKYKTVVVTSASEKLVAGKFGMKIDVDTSGDDVIVSVKKDGEEVKARNLKKMDIATVLETINNEGDRVINIDVCTKTVTGAITTLDTEKDRTYIEADGQKFEVDKKAIDDINVGSESTLYLDKFGRVAYIESTAGGKLSGNEKYGWLMSVYESEDGEDLEIKLYSQDGKVVTAKAAGNLRYVGNVAGEYTSTTLKTKDATDRRALRTAAKALDSQIKVDGTDYPVKLVKYSTNSAGEMNMLAMPTIDAAQTNGVVVSTTNFRSQMSSANVVAGQYSISTSTVEFTVPRTAEDMRSSTSTYAAKQVEPDKYMGREGVSEDFILAEFDGKKAGVLVKYVVGSSSAADSSYGTADNVPIGLITGFSTQYDADLDEAVYGVKVSTSGAETQYTTKEETTIALHKGAIGRDIGGTPIWQMNKPVEGVTGINSVRDAIDVGDIIGYKTSGTKLDTVVRLLDMSKFAGMLQDGATVAEAMQVINNDTSTEASKSMLGSEMDGMSRSKDRDAIVFAEVTEVDIEDTVQLTVTYPLSGKQDIVPIASNKAIDIYEYETGDTDTDDATGIFEGDIVFVKYYRGDVQQVMVIRP